MAGRFSHTYEMPRVQAPVLLPRSVNGFSQPVLEFDDRFLLRPWTLDDVPVVVAAYSDPEIQRWMPYSYDMPEAAQVITIWGEAWKTETARAGPLRTSPMALRVAGWPSRQLTS